LDHGGFQWQSELKNVSGGNRKKVYEVAAGFAYTHPGPFLCGYQQTIQWVSHNRFLKVPHN